MGNTFIQYICARPPVHQVHICRVTCQKYIKLFIRKMYKKTFHSFIHTFIPFIHSISLSLPTQIPSYTHRITRRVIYRKYHRCKAIHYCHRSRGIMLQRVEVFNFGYCMLYYGSTWSWVALICSVTWSCGDEWCCAEWESEKVSRLAWRIYTSTLWHDQRCKDLVE